MEAKHIILTAYLLLAAMTSGLCQPVITNQPSSLTNIAGTTATFSVGATGTEPLAYQWRLSTSDLAGKTNDTLIVTNVQTPLAGAYTVVVTNVDGAVTSAVATLTVLVPPTIIAFSPTNQSVSLGANPAFSVRASGTPPLYYNLRFNHSDLPGKTNLTSSLTGTLVVTNAQTTSAGDYTVVITNLAGSATSAVAHLEVDPSFTKITTGSIVTDLGIGVGCAWGDYDGDGFIDLFVTSVFDQASGIGQKNFLFHNNRDGTFTKITNTVVTAEARDWHGCSWVDYDNDGNLDLFVVSDDEGGNASQNELFRNNGNGTFTKMTPTAVGPIASLAAGSSQGPVWGDYDRDGFVDLYLVRRGPDWMFHNNGDGSFTEVPNNIGIPVDNNNTFRAMWGDYDNDGWPDLFLPIRTDNNIPPVRSLLYHGLGDGTFTNVQTGILVTNLGQSPGCAWADYDNDGYLDLFVTSKGGTLPNLLYHNNGDGTFTKMTSNTVGSIVSDLPPVGMSGCSWGDYDNDGFQDLFVASIPVQGGSTTNYLYHNNGDGSFSRVLTGSLVNDLTTGAISCAWGDYDNDGFLDLFVPCGGAWGVRDRNLLYRNNGNSNGWLKVKLVGTASNRSAVGAKVRVQATIRGRAMWQMREINTGDGWNASPLEAHFGLGDATNIDLVRIEWPSGIVQMLTNVAPRQFLTVVERQQPGAANPPTVAGVSRSANGVVSLSATGDTGLLYLLEASTNLVNWTKLSVRSNATGMVAFTDPKATNYASRFYRVTVP